MVKFGKRCGDFCQAIFQIQCLIAEPRGFTGYLKH